MVGTAASAATQKKKTDATSEMAATDCLGTSEASATSAATAASATSTAATTSTYDANAANHCTRDFNCCSNIQQHLLPAVKQVAQSTAAATSTAAAIFTPKHQPGKLLQQ